MKKGQIAEGTVVSLDFPNKGIVHTDDGERVVVKNALPGQRVSFQVNKARKGKAEARLLEIIEHSPIEVESPCPHFGICGGCTYQTLPYEEQLALKEMQVRRLLEQVLTDSCKFLGILPSPRIYGYRNKMEFSFGDEYKNGPLALGMHKRGSFYDIVTVSNCQIADMDFRKILTATLEYFSSEGTSFFHRMSHEGYLRHLLVRKAARTGEILVDLVTTTQESSQEVQTTICKEQTVAQEKPAVSQGVQESSQEVQTTICKEQTVALEIRAEMADVRTGRKEDKAETRLLAGWRDKLLALPLEGNIKGILHTYNDSVADIIRNDGTDILYGDDYFYEEILGLKFRITPFSFFQTNSLGAEVLYGVARDFILDGDEDALRNKTVYDLYSGTGTIAQVIAPVCKEVVGVEIVEEAVLAARENAKLNGLSNCKFLAGDVLKVLDTIEEKPDVIILDPPRDGIHPKALEKIIAYGVERIVYISCKPTSLARDLEVFQARGYGVEKIKCVDMFVGTGQVETCALITKSSKA